MTRDGLTVQLTTLSLNHICIFRLSKWGVLVMLSTDLAMIRERRVSYHTTLPSNPGRTPLLLLLLRLHDFVNGPDLVNNCRCSHGPGKQ